MFSYKETETETISDAEIWRQFLIASIQSGLKTDYEEDILLADLYLAAYVKRFGGEEEEKS